MGYFTNSPDEAESSFYAAFEHLDLELMKATWHKSNETFCVHPGGPVHQGYEEVIKTWDFILKGTDSVSIAYNILSKQSNADLEIHLVEEKIGPQDDQVTILSTNTYIHTDEGWRILSHHTSLPPAEKKPATAPKQIH